jgi:hypothetical protein
MSGVLTLQAWYWSWLAYEYQEANASEEAVKADEENADALEVPPFVHSHPWLPYTAYFQHRMSSCSKVPRDCLCVDI